METKKFQTGAFVFTRARGLEPRAPETLKALTQKHGIDENAVPDYAGDRPAVMRAIAHTQAGLSRKGLLLRPIKRTSTEVIYGIVREERDETARRLDHDFEATITWNAERDRASVEGDHPVAAKVREEYQTLRGKVVSDDWSAAITAFLESHDAARVRSDGRIYWVPPQRLDDIKRFGELLAEVGIDLVLCELEPEVRVVAQDVASLSLEEELERLQSEADAFDGTQKPSTYARRLEEYQRLRERAILYRDALGCGVERASQVLGELEEKVEAMLGIRRLTVIHRDGTSTKRPGNSSAESSPAAPDEGTSKDVPHPALHFAGISFTMAGLDSDTLIFVSDEDSAKKSVASLEAMGLAGIWQQAGKVRLKISNSGPEGAAVSIRIKPSDRDCLSASAPALALMGIEIIQ